VFEDLVSTAATTIVAAMATSAWQTTSTGVQRLFKRFSPDDLHSVGRDLEVSSSKIENADDRDKVRGRLRGVWEQRIEELLETDPEVARELEALMLEVQRLLPAQEQRWVQSITASGTGSLAVGAQGGNVIFHGSAINSIDSPSSTPQQT
jgi:hypothetical protein